MTPTLTSGSGWRLDPPPAWPAPPEGWQPPPAWVPDRTWKRPPRGWQLWLPGEPLGAPEPGAAAPARDLTWAEPLGGPVTDRRRTRFELLVVLLVFPLPALITAGLLLLRSSVDGLHASPVDKVLPGHDLISSLAGSVEYAGTALPVVALVAFVLSGSGVPFRALGLTRVRLARDLLAGTGIVASGLVLVFVSGLVVYGVFGDKGLPGTYDTTLDSLSPWYLIDGITVSFVTALVEETVINGYLLTRLGQLGWTPRKALAFGMLVRTSYHLYYGLGLVFTLPVGYFLTRSYQRHRRLQRVVFAHFLYDAVLISIAILTG